MIRVSRILGGGSFDSVLPLAAPSSRPYVYDEFVRTLTAQFAPNGITSPLETALEGDQLEIKFRMPTGIETSCALSPKSFSFKLIGELTLGTVLDQLQALAGPISTSLQQVLKVTHWTALGTKVFLQFPRGKAPAAPTKAVSYLEQHLSLIPLLDRSGFGLPQEAQITLLYKNETERCFIQLDEDEEDEVSIAIDVIFFQNLEIGSLLAPSRRVLEIIPQRLEPLLRPLVADEAVASNAKPNPPSRGVKS